MRILVPFLFFVFWMVVLVANQSGFVRFQSTSDSCLWFLLSGIFIMISCFVFPARSAMIKPLKLNLKRGFIGLCCGIALVSLALQGLKFSGLFSQFQSGFSLRGATEVRVLNTGGELGSSWVGAFGTLLSGMPVVCGLIAITYEGGISRMIRFVLLGICGLGFVLVLVAGGRNGVVIGALMILMAKLASLPRLSQIWKYWGYGLVLFFFGLVFLQIFVDRFSVVYGDSVDIADYFSEKPGVAKVIDLGSWINVFGLDLVTGFCFLDFYLGHSVTELDYLLSAELSENAPYLGEYNFFPAILLLSKFGLATSRISEILLVLPNPGVYTTLLGGLYLDFGIIGSLIFAGIFSWICGMCLRIFKKTGRLVPLYWFSLLSVSMLMSPFYTTFPTSLFPSLIFLGVLLIVFEKMGGVYGSHST